MFGGMTHDESAMHDLIQSGSTAALTQEESQAYAEEHQGDEWKPKEPEHDEEERRRMMY
jgi:hypothetical protein